MWCIYIVTPNTFTATTTLDVPTTLGKLMGCSQEWRFDDYTELLDNIHDVCPTATPAHCTLAELFAQPNIHYVYVCSCVYMQPFYIQLFSNIAVESDRHVDADDALMIIYSYDATRK